MAASRDRRGSPGAIRIVGVLYALGAILSVPMLLIWSVAIPSTLREPGSKGFAFLAIFALVSTIVLAAGLAGWGLLTLRPWARVVALGLNALGAAPILFEIVSDPRVTSWEELVLPGVVLLCLAGVSALLLHADFDGLRRAGLEAC